MKSVDEVPAAAAAAVDRQVPLASDDGRRGIYPWYVLVVLLLIYAIQTIDRQIIAITMEPIRAEFGLNDRQLGLLTSLSFAAAYALTCVPLGLLADRWSRKRLLAAVLTVWSGFTTLNGLAQSFWHLLAARVAVGAAEAGNNPTAMSLIADYFGPRNRATAMSFYFFGQSLGVFGGFIVGGMVAVAYGWRAAFWAAGLPGLLLAVVLLCTVREPLRERSSKGNAPETHTAPSLKDVLRLVLSQRSTRHLMAGNVVSSFIVAGIVTWSASFLIRTHGMDSRSAGQALGIALGLAVLVGSGLGGLLADRIGRSDVQLRPRMIALYVIVSVPLFAGALWMDAVLPAIVLLGLAASFNAMQYGPTYALLPSLVPPRMRATSTAMVFFCNNLIGYGCGPFAVGLLSDALEPTTGAASLRYAMLSLLFLQVLAAWLFLRASTTLKSDLAQAEQA